MFEGLRETKFFDLLRGKIFKKPAMVSTDSVRDIGKMSQQDVELLSTLGMVTGELNLKHKVT